MTTLEFCQKHVVFARSGSPITGPFRIEMYPFLRKPFEAADDIRTKRLVLYKSSSSMGTVAGQCILAKRIIHNPGDMLFCAQTDDDASTWSKTRGKEFLLSIPPIRRFLSREKYAVTNDLFQFRGKFLAITGPGIASAQSVQVTTLMTDETHLESWPDGRIVEFEKRLGGRWNRLAVHVTTAPDERGETGDYREVHGFWLNGQQDEWNFRCPKCAKLVAPLWGEDSREKYNGHEVFHEKEDSVIFLCPHCVSGIYSDTSRERYALVKDGDYVSANPSAPADMRSFQWPVWAMHPISWAGLLAEHRGAMAAAKMGNLKPLEDWRKKRLAVAWVPILPDFGDGKGANDYKLGDVWECGESEKFMGIDFQAGKGDEGAHLWCLIVQYDRAGHSRRLAYRKVQTFAQAEALANEFEVKPFKVYCDSGYESRVVFRECGKRNWLTVRGSDETEFLHTKEIAGEMRNFSLPYSPWTLQSGNIGQKSQNIVRKKGSRAPTGWAWNLVSANNCMYGYLSACIGGGAGKYFGIASDFPEEYRKSMPAFVQVVEKDKFGRNKKPIWKPVRETHAWDCEIYAMIGAIRSGFFPIAGIGDGIKSKAENQESTP